MCCPVCEYEMRPGQTDCPRCSFRRAVRAAPPPVAATETVAVLSPAPPPPLVTAPGAAPKAARPRWAEVAVASVALTVLLLAFFLRDHTPALTPRESQIQAIFITSEGPCRHGDRQFCMQSVDRIRALGDLPDGSLLLGDCNIARYLRTLPDGGALAGRWQRDEITVPELTHFGDVAYAQGLNVCRSFWMYAQVKRDHVAVPQFVLSGATS